MNGSPTYEVKIQRRMKQSNPIAPLRFLIMAERLAGLVRSTVLSGIFKGFNVGNGGAEVFFLQYADDTLFVGEAN